ncbi:DDB1- and CUL4-associated factor 15-like [Argonauta hians]
MAALCSRINGGNLMSKLLSREVRGSLQTHSRQRKEKFFKKIPGRLCFKLTSLVPRVLLDDGYVFLGFTKDGQFVISYSLQVDTDENTGFLPVYVYNLQWWWFIPYKPLKKVSEVRLFENGIEPDIFIAICEWPADRSKILVYGHSVPRSREEGSQCFITITAVPPLNACKDCYITESNSSSTKRKKKVMCVKHSFCIYSKYELAPPFPAFIPQIQLKMDGMVVLNTGDSLVALDFRINQPVTQCKVGNDCRDESKRLFSCGTTASANPGVEGSRTEAYHNLINGYYDFRDSPTGSSDSAAESDEDCWGKNTSRGLPANKASGVTNISVTTSNIGSASTTNSTTANNNLSKCCQRTRLHSVVNPSNPDSVDPYSCCSAETTANSCRHSKTPCWNCDSENACPPSLTNSGGGGGGGDDSTNRCMKQSCCTVCDRTLTSSTSCCHHHHHHHHHHNNNNHHHHHLHHSHHHLAPTTPPAPPTPPTSSCCDLHNRLSDSNGKRCRVVKHRNSCVLVDPVKSDSTSPPPAPPPPAVFQRSSKLNVLEECPKKNGTASSVVSPHSKCYCTATADSDTKENLVVESSASQPLSPPNNISQQPFFSANNSGGGSSAAQNSNENHPVYLHINESRSMSFSMRKFTYLEDNSRENILLNEDDFDLAYRSILPLDVRGADHKLMSITKSNVDLDQSDHITVCQLTLDIEHFLEEVIHTVAEWGHRYIAFLNYDLQLLDVNAESGEVLAKVFALVQARKDFNEKKPCKRSNILKQYYQTSITFNWSLLTGNYSTFHIEDLVEVDETDLLRKEWNPGNGEVTRLQHALAVPQSFYKSVYTLTNEAVIRGNSLTLILAPHHIVAISR